MVDITLHRINFARAYDDITRPNYRATLCNTYCNRELRVPIVKLRLRGEQKRELVENGKQRGRAFERRDREARARFRTSTANRNRLSRALITAPARKQRCISPPVFTEKLFYATCWANKITPYVVPSPGIIAGGNRSTCDVQHIVLNRECDRAVIINHYVDRSLAISACVWWTVRREFTATRLIESP